MEDDFFYMITIMLSQSSCVSPPSLFLCLQQPSGVQRQCLLLGEVSAGETQRIGDLDSQNLPSIGFCTYWDFRTEHFKKTI